MVRFGLEREQLEETLLCAMNDASCMFRSGVCVRVGMYGGAIANIKERRSGVQGRLRFLLRPGQVRQSRWPAEN